MIDPRRLWPQGSYNRPVPIPTSAPGDLPLLCLQVNVEWMPYILGCLKQLMLPSTWGDVRDPVAQAATYAANDLIALFAEAADCGAGDVAGTYAETCLEEPVEFGASTLTPVQELTVEPGEYELVAEGMVGFSVAAAHFTISVWAGATLLVEKQLTTGNAGYYSAYAMTVKVAPTVETVYTVQVETYATGSFAYADPPDFGGTAHVTTCLRAYPLGLSGPVGPAGDPGPATMLRFTAGCVMQYSTDSGATWLDVPGWDTFAPGCFAGFDGASIPISEIDPADPPNVQGVDQNQQACNIAAYLAQQVIRGAVNEAQRQANLTKTALDFGVALLALIPGIDIAELGFVEGANILYGLVDGDNLADFTAAATDETLWTEVVCAIYGAIAIQGKVNAGNFGNVATALGAISYSHTEVPTALALFWSGLGLQAVQAAQVPGALTVADCSSCSAGGPWCTWWQTDEVDMCGGDWVAIPHGTFGTLATCADSAWTATADIAGNWWLAVEATLPQPREITTARMDFGGGVDTGFHTDFIAEDGSVLYTTAVKNWVGDPPGTGRGPVYKVRVYMGPGAFTFDLGSIKLGGPDEGSPWGENNGVCD